MKLISIIALSTLMLTGCGTPSSKLYLLEPVVDSQQSRTPTEAQDIGLAVVKVPGYANSKSVASRRSGNRIVVDDRNQWAEDPDAAITRVLANRMRAYSGGNVIVEPWPRGFEPQARVEFEFDKLLRDENGGAEVSGQLRVISGDGREVIAVKNFQVLHEAGGKGMKDFFKALSLAINDITRLAIYSLQRSEAPDA